MPTTIFTNSSWTDDSGNEGVSVRQILIITGGAQGQVRVTFKAASAATFKTDHAAVGIYTGTLSNTTATPVELLFSGGHGFTISSGATVTSDWANLTGFTSSDDLVVIYDVNAVGGSGANAQNVSGVPAGDKLYFQAASASYNTAVPGFSSVNTGIIAAVATIEVQSAGVLFSLGDYTIDQGLTGLDTVCDKIYICAAAPTSYADATSGANSLGNKNWGAGNAFSAPAPGTGGRQITSIAITDGAVTANGTVAAWAAVDSAGSQLLASGGLTGGVAVTNGQVFTLSAMTLNIPST